MDFAFHHATHPSTRALLRNPRYFRRGRRRGVLFFDTSAINVTFRRVSNWFAACTRGMQTRGSGWTRGGYNAGARTPGERADRAHPFALWMHLISHLFVRIAELAITSPSYKRAAICRPIVNRPLRLDSRVINRGYRIRVYGEFMFTVAMRVFATAEEKTSLLSRVGNVKSVAAVDYSRL